MIDDPVEILQTVLQDELHKKYCDERVLALLEHGNIITIHKEWS